MGYAPGQIVRQGRYDDIAKDEEVRRIYLGQGQVMLHIENLSAGYGDIAVLHQITLAVQPNEVVGCSDAMEREKRRL